MGQGGLDSALESRLVELTGAHRCTVRRWQRRPRLPRWLEHLIRICVHGELADIDRAWRGWRIDRGELISPEGWHFTPGAVMAGELYRQRVCEMGDRDRAARMMLEADPVNRAGLERLAVLQAALEGANGALAEITDRLTALERNRLFAEAHRLRGDSSSSLRKVV